MLSAPSHAAAKKAREYETIYILRPNVTTEEAEKVASRVEEVINRLEGKITKVDSWGRRKLAYSIKKHTRGVFIYVKYVGFSDVVAELERNLRMLDSVLRHQTVRISDYVDLTAVSVNPEEVKFAAIEQVEDEPELDAAQRLGLVPSKSKPKQEIDDEDDLGDDDLDDIPDLDDETNH